MNPFEAEIEAASLLAQQLGPFARAILVDTAEGRFAVPIEDMHVGLQLRQRGSYSSQERETLRQLCKPSSRVLIVGAHIGSLAIPLAKSCESLTAIEANPGIFELLKLNLQLNGLKNIRIIQTAASDRHETISFVLNRVNSGGSERMPTIKNPIYFHDNPEIINLSAAPLDDVLSDQSFEVILMDIEGSEYPALKGMQRLLRDAVALQVEFIPHHLINVANISAADFLAPIQDHFTALVVPHRRLVTGRDQFADVLGGMVANNEASEGLLFLKADPSAISWA
ncbi:MAG: FkbM family methyltransferase [Cyanobium sp.]